MGSKSLPDFPNSKSDKWVNCEILCWAKNSLPMTFLDLSSAMALIPFSQYSPNFDLSSSGSGQAQPGQSKPPFWFILRLNLMASIDFMYLFICPIEDMMALLPTEFSLGSVNRIPEDG